MCLLRSVAQKHGWYVNAAHELAARFNIGVPRDSVKLHVGDIKRAFGEAEDPSSIDVEDLRNQLLEAYPEAAEPFAAEVLRAKYPKYKENAAEQKAARSMVSEQSDTRAVV